MKKTKGFEQPRQTTTVKEFIGNEVEELVMDAPRATISQELLEQFERFYEYHPAARLSRNLRSLLLEFLMYDGSTEAEYLRDLVIDLDGLFTLLDAMQEEAESPAAPAV
jgi:hypothetical protein